MKKEYINVNTNKLHDELINAGIAPLLVESLNEKTWITFADDVDMTAVQAVIDAHDPTPLPEPLSEIDKLKISQAEQFETILELLGGMM